MSQGKSSCITHDSSSTITQHGAVGSKSQPLASPPVRAEWIKVQHSGFWRAIQETGFVLYR